MRWRMLAWICLAELGALSLWFSATAVIPALRTPWMSIDAQAWLSMAVTARLRRRHRRQRRPDPGRLRRRSAALRRSRRSAAPLVNAVLLIVIESLPLVLACRFLTGLAMAGTYPPAMKLAASWFVTDRGLAVGSLVGALTRGRRAAAPDQLRGRPGLVARDRRDVPRRARGRPRHGDARRDGPHVQARAPFNPACVGELLRSRGVVLANLGYFGHMWELYAMWTWIGLYLLEAFTRAGPARGPAPRGAGDGRGDRRGRGELRRGGLPGGPHRAHRHDDAGDGRERHVRGGDRARVRPAGAPGPGGPRLGLHDRRRLGPVLGGRDRAGPAAPTSGPRCPSRRAWASSSRCVSTWLVPRAAEAWGWPWAFAFLAPGPFLGALAMALLRRLPESAKLAQGRRGSGLTSPAGIEWPDPIRGPRTAS